MTTFEVKDMSCGHCVSAITKAVKDVDQDAKLRFDLATHRVTIDSIEADAAALSNAICRAGYTPAAVKAGVEHVVDKAAAARGSCCCG